jgi:hypothetical protein
MFNSASPIGVMKVDVEHHELDVFRGGEALLSHHSIRDIVFEEGQPYPNDTTNELERHGYILFKLSHSILGPCLLDAKSHEHSPTGDQSYLATVDVERAQHRLANRGWAIFGRGSVLCRPR